MYIYTYTTPAYNGRAVNAALSITYPGHTRPVSPMALMAKVWSSDLNAVFFCYPAAEPLERKWRWNKSRRGLRESVETNAENQSCVQGRDQTACGD